MNKRWAMLWGLAAITLVCHGLFFYENTSAIAKESTITVTIEDGNQSINVMPGDFGKSGNTTINVSTDNYTGYSLQVISQNTTSMVNSNEDEIESISSNVDESTFSSDNNYFDKWGFRPNQYIASNNGINTVVQNTNYLPAPSTTGLLIDKTGAANSTANTYTLAFAAKVSQELPAGVYTHVNVIYAVANDIIYNVTYDDNTTDTVTNMPTPNPQATTISGGTPAAESYATLSDAVPIRNEKKFAGWCDVATGTDSETGDDTCSGTLYQPEDNLPVDQTAGPNITLYAMWVESLFPIVWNQMGACEFHGATNDNITGSECTDYHNDKFIDTGIALYNQANYLKDYEIHFTIDSYDPADQVNYYGSEDNGQQTFANAKLSTTAGDEKSPGVAVRRQGGSSIQFSSKINDTQEAALINYTQVHEVSMFRLDNKIYYSVNNGPLIFLQDITGFSQQFGLTTWFGAYPRDNCTGDLVRCTNAKRIPEATLSNMYIRLGEYSDDDIHTIDFKTNDGTDTIAATYLIKDGNTITTLPSDPTYTDHLFQGWFTEQSGGTQVTTSTIPSSSTSYWAHWLGTVATANIANPSIALQPQASETINVTNSSELEPYIFTSNNTSVATVDENTGTITAVAPGTTTITMTGTTSGETRSITVTVAGQTYTVYFDAQGGSSVEPVTVGDGSSISPLPTSIKASYMLEGWYTGTNGTGTKLTTSTVFDSNTPTQYYANWEEMIYVCKIATTLHTESCNQSSGNGCRATGFAASDVITYGHLVASTTETHGAAYDCDVDYDGVYDSETERFYYFGTENGNAKFIHYVNMNNNASVAYNTAISYLPNYELDTQNPNVPVWDNPNLITYTTGTYAGKAARFMTYPEITDGLWSGGNTGLTPSNGASLYLFEKSNFANTNTTDGIWLEAQTNYNNRIQTRSRGLTHGSTSANASRATIEVPTQFVEPYIDPSSRYTITFDPHNETSSWTESITPGSALDSSYPSADPTYADHLFQGWYTAATGGSIITSATVPAGDTTYHAQWLKTVVLAELANNSVMVEAGSTATINVTNSAELELYTFTSNDTSIATVNSTTGVVTGVTDGTTTITMTGTTSGATKTINVTVADLLPVTQAIIANNDLTVTEGEQITVIVSNSALLEPYTFSSDNSAIATVDNSGVITGVSAGTTNIIMTGTNSGLTKTLEVSVTAAPVIQHTVTFDANGGTLDSGASSTRLVNDGENIGALPTASKANHMFFGWYTDDDTFYDEVYQDKTINENLTLYARWVENTSSFPIEFAEINECTFNGNAVISGTYCTQDKTKKYVDAGVALFSTSNYEKDFEIGFTVVELDSPQPQNQATLVNSKRENSATNYPGFVMRSSSTGPIFELTARFSHGSPTAVNTNGTTLKRVKIVRENGILKYSFNDGTLTTWYDVTGNTHRFDTNVWFGATVTSNDTGSQRYLSGKLTDMYVKLGAPTEYTVELNANGGTLPSGVDNVYTITIGDPVGSLPTPTAPSANYTFSGWYNGDTLISDGTQYIPTSNVTLTAHWTYNSSDTPVTFDVSNDATRGYKTIINNWVSNPVNITTFNKNTTTINDSTWGDTSELSEAQFWTTLKNNFQTNQCMVPSYGDAATTTPNPTAWTNGSVDCAKPDVYDTLLGEPLNVYLYNNQTLGAQVTYAEADDGIIRNLIPGNTYKWEKDGDSSVYGYITVTSNGSDHGTRWVDTGIIRNARDLGGLPADTDDDGTIDAYVDYGRLFRGEKLWNASATELTNLGINKEYDVGNPSEYAGNTKLPDYQNDEVVHYNFDYNSGDEDNASSNYMKAWRAVTDIMTDISSNNKNIYFHCRVGADRTGTVAYLLEGLMGVPDEERYQEYSLTHLSGLFDRTRYYKQKTSTNNLKFVFMMDYVQTTQDIIDWYMKNPNANANLITAFRSAVTTSIASPSTTSAQQNNSGSMQTNSAQTMNSYMSTQNTNTEAANNNTGDNNNNNNNNEQSNVDTGSTTNASNSYNEPLGETQSTEATDNSPNNWSLGVAAVATSAAVATGAAYALSKKSNEQDES